MPTKMGGKSRLSVHLAGNQHLLDATLPRASGGRRLDAGIAETVTDRSAGAFSLEIDHSPRSDHRTLAAQIASDPLSSSGADVVLLDLDPDVFSEECSAQAFLDSMTSVVQHVKKLGAHLIFVNASTLDPTDVVSNYAGRPEPFARKAQKLDLALLTLSIREGISIIDVDRLFAEAGGRRLVQGPLDYTEEGCSLIRDEIVRVLYDYGFFEVRPLVEQVGTNAP